MASPPKKTKQPTPKSLANLRPYGNDTPAALERTRAAGRKGNFIQKENIRKRKSAAQYAKMLLESNVTGKEAERLQREFEIASSEDLTHAAAMVAGQIKVATKGDTRAAEFVLGLNEKAELIDESRRNYTIDATLLIADYLETYRIVRQRFEGKNQVREIILKGGRATLKTTFACELVYETIMRDPEAHAVMCRRYKVDVSKSVLKSFLQTINRIGDRSQWKVTLSPCKAVFLPTGQTVMFEGCDNPQSLKSYAVEWGHVAMVVFEECDQFRGPEMMDSVEDTFLRSDFPAISMKIFNPPPSKLNFMNAYVIEKRDEPTTHICHSVYTSVPVEWLGQRFIDRANWFKEHKPKYYANNYLGEAVGTGGELFENVEEVKFTREFKKKFANLPTFQGIDWGWVHPSVFIRAAYDSDHQAVYILKEHYTRGKTLKPFLRAVDEYKDEETICDSASPEKTAEAVSYGWNAINASKRVGDKGREWAWEWLSSRLKIYVDPSITPEIAKELRTLEFEVLRDGSRSEKAPTVGEDGVMALIYALNREIMRPDDEDAYYSDSYALYDDDDYDEYDE